MSAVEHLEPATRPPWPTGELAVVSPPPSPAPPVPPRPGALRGRHARHPPPSARRQVLQAAAIVAGAAALAGGVVVGSAWYHLVALESAVKAGDVPAARGHLAGVRGDLRLVRLATAPLHPLRTAPVVGGPLRDVGHGLDAAGSGLDAASTGLDLLDHLVGGRLIHGGRIDVEGLAETPTLAGRVGDQLTAMRTELAAVGGGWAPGLTGWRDGGLQAADGAIAQARIARTALAALPVALGSQGPRTYVVATLNSGELLPSGGAMLAVAMLRLDDGRPHLLSRAQVSQVTDLNKPVPWTPLASDPWQRRAGAQRLANANYSPDFPTSGEEILRLYQAQFGTDASGVVALDGPAFATLLTMTGPLHVARYGVLTAANVVRLTLYDSYAQYDGSAAQVNERHEANNQLIDALFTALIRKGPSGDGVTAALRSLADGHLQVYFRDPALQGVLAQAGVSHALQPIRDDALGIYTINTNASKLDVFQQRDVSQDVVLDAAGRAAVTRTVVIRNVRDRPCPAMARRRAYGYEACVSMPRIALYLPESATDVTLTADGAPVVPVGEFTEAGRRVLVLARTLEPDAAVRLVLTYRLPADGSGGYTLAYDGQPMVTEPRLVVRVVPAPGSTLTGPGWSTEAGGRLIAEVPLVGHGELTALPAPAAPNR